MTPQQVAAFHAGTGENFTAFEMFTLIQGIGGTAVFIWAVWASVSAYRDWGAEEITQGDMIGIWFRCVFMMMVLLWLLST